MKCIDQHCNKEAEYVVSKKSDLSHRTAEYCTEHASPYRLYPEYFEIKRTTEKYEND